MMDIGPEKIIAAATPEVRNALTRILEIERDYQYYKRLDRTVLREIEGKIAGVIAKESTEQ